MRPTFRTLLPALGVALLAACSEPEGAAAKSSPAAVPAAAPAAAAAPLPTVSQQEMLQIAFAAASALPLDPHQKTRARLQQQVAGVWLQLDQPQRAADCIEQIRNWRRGIGYADLACYRIRHGDAAAAPALLQLAEREAQQAAQDPNAQDWPPQRIRAGIARAQWLLGDAAAANKNTIGLPEFELGGVERVRVAQLDAAAFDGEAATLRQVIATGSFDAARGALDTALQLFDSFYADGARRQQMQQLLLTGYDKLPADVRIDLCMRAADAALRHDDHGTALTLLEAARQRLGAEKWLPEHEAPMLARLGALMHRAGDSAAGRRDADAAFARYLAGAERIVDIYRAGALRPIAEAWLELGDRDKALMVYKRAVEAGAVNANARPRAEDLVATCCSLALHRLEPDSVLRARLQQVHDGLGAPW